MVVQGTANQEVPKTKKKEVPPLKHLLIVLGQCSPGIVLDQSSLGTVLGQYSLETIQSWDATVLGQWSWDSGLGTVVLGD